MKYRVLTIISGVLFSIGLAILSYLSMVLGVALSLSGNDWFVNMMFVFAILTIANIVGVCLTKKKPVATIYISVVSVITVLFTIFYIFSLGGSDVSGLIIAFFIAELIFGILTALFAILYKRKVKIKSEVKNIEEN